MIKRDAWLETGDTYVSNYVNWKETERTITDADGNAEWSKMILRPNTYGATAGDFIWRTEHVYWDTAPGELAKLMRYTENDVSNSSIYEKSRDNHYDRSGHLRQIDTRFDSGDESVTMYTNNGTKASYWRMTDVVTGSADNLHWSKQEAWNFDATAGKWERHDIAYDNGLRTSTLNDTNRSDSYARIDRSYDPSGRLVDETLVGDNGVTTHVHTEYQPDGDIINTVRMDPGTGQDIAVADDGVTRAVFVEGQPRPLFTLDLTDQDQLDGIQAFADEKALLDLARGVLRLDPRTRAILGIIAAAGLVYEFFVGATPTVPPAVPIYPVPTGIPDDARFVYGTNGVDYYLTKSGQMWEFGPSGLRMTNLINNQTVVADDVDACTWRWDTNEAAMRARPAAYQEQITGLPVGLVCFRDGVKFDSYNYAIGAYIEVKGLDFVNERFYPDGSPAPWLRGYQSMVKQLEDQARAANGRPVHWYVPDEATATVVRDAIRTIPAADGRVTVFVEPVRP